MTYHPAIRASDSDREHVAERLRVATAEGRLAPEELDERLEALFASRTYGELQRLVADLPAPVPAVSEHSRGVKAPVWVAFTVSGALLLAVLGALTTRHSGAAAVGPRGSGVPQHVIFFSRGPSASFAILFTLVLAATLVAAAGWSYSRLAGRERRLSS